MHLSFFFIRQNNRFERIEFADILYLESRKNYVRIVTVKKTMLVLSPLKKIESLLPANAFCRIHRSYIISISALTAFNYNFAYLGECPIPISEAFREALEEKLILISRQSDHLPTNQQTAQ